MGKFIRIVVLVLFIIVAGIVPALAMGHHGGHGGGGGAPEIDPSMASSAITLLSCGVLILTDKFRRKR